MRLLSFVSPKNGETEWGVQIEDHVVGGMSIAPTLDSLIELGQPGLDELRATVQSATAPDYPVSEVHVVAPLRGPSKVVAIGQNYRDHCRESNVPVPTRPIVFAKFPTSIIGPTDEVRWRTDLTDQVDWEVELGVVIGRATRHVPEDAALDYVFGYTVINDVSARDLQRGDGQWVRAKSLDTFCPVGPVIVTAEEIPDPQDLGLRCLVNGTPMQDSSTREMVFSVRHLISFLSRAFTLNPGDLIASGTPHGVGAGRNPPVFLRDGDVIETEVDHIGCLRNVCRVEA